MEMWRAVGLLRRLVQASHFSSRLSLPWKVEKYSQYALVGRCPQLTGPLLRAVQKASLPDPLGPLQDFRDEVLERNRFHYPARRLTFERGLSLRVPLRLRLRVEEEPHNSGAQFAFATPEAFV